MPAGVRQAAPHMSEEDILNGIVAEALEDPNSVRAEACKRSLFVFVQEFWHTVIQDPPVWNWHIPYLCRELQSMAERVGAGQAKEYDLIINVPPGTTKSTLVVQMLPAWTWARWPWMRHICGSYSGELSTEHGGLCKQIVSSERWEQLFPKTRISPKQDARSNFKIEEYKTKADRWYPSGGRQCASVGGTITGKHAHMILVDDPINPKQAVSDSGIQLANDWMDQTLSTRKVDKSITPTVLVMQRLNEDDPTGHMLTKKGKRIKHICLPGSDSVDTGKEVVATNIQPPEAQKYYVDGLLDPLRLNREVLNEMRLDLGEYGFAGQVLQDPAPPEGGMFKISMLMENVVPVPPAKIISTVRYWDKAGTEGGGAYTVGAQVAKMDNGGFIIMDIIRGQWGPDKREQNIRHIAERDGAKVKGYIEQEPGSGGKDSALATIRNLVGYPYYADRPTGDKIYRADPLAAQINTGNVWVLKANWNRVLFDEMRMFPNGNYKDQVDALSGAFSKLADNRKRAGALRRRTT